MKNQRWNSSLLFVNMQDYSVYFHSALFEYKIGRGECIFPDGVKRQNNCLCLSPWMSGASPALLWKSVPHFIYPMFCQVSLTQAQVNQILSPFQGWSWLAATQVHWCAQHNCLSVCLSGSSHSTTVPQQGRCVEFQSTGRRLLSQAGYSQSWE